MTKIYHAHLYGNRDSKYEWLQGHDVLSTDWQAITPQAPFYLLIPQDTDLLGEYEKGWKITDAMPVNSVGIVTARDSLTIHWTKEEIWETVRDFSSIQPEVAREKYELGKDSSDWKITLAQADLKRAKLSRDKIVPILYRPFDIRYTYYTGNSGGFHCRARSEVMQNLIKGSDIGFICTRQTRDEWSVLITDSIIGHKSLAAYDIGSLIPLYLYPDRNEITQERRVNFSPEFLKHLTGKLGTTPTPEAIFYYIYAVFHSPTYRTRYAEFLKIDFPRVPLTRNLDLFHQLAAYGEELVTLHLMKSPRLDTALTQYLGNSDPIVDPGHPKFLLPSPSGRGAGGEGGKVIINKKGDGFIGVPEQVWNFYIGGYQVCHKWLKDRKGRTLSPEDITHYQRIIVALQETIRLMQQIDAAIPGWPLE